MNTIVVKTVAELLALRDSEGAIEIEGNLIIECNVLWEGDGEKINGIRVNNLACYAVVI